MSSVSTGDGPFEVNVSTISKESRMDGERAAVAPRRSEAPGAVCALLATTVPPVLGPAASFTARSGHDKCCGHNNGQHGCAPGSGTGCQMVRTTRRERRPHDQSTAGRTE